MMSLVLFRGHFLTLCPLLSSSFNYLSKQWVLVDDLTPLEQKQSQTNYYFKDINKWMHVYFF